MDIISDLRVNKNKLDDELVNQPSLFFQYSELCTEAIENKDTEKVKCEEIKSLTSRRIRSERLSSGAKTTDKIIEEDVNCDSDYLDSKEDFIAATKKASTFINALEAFKQRQKSISKLCDLYLASYYTNDDYKHETNNQKAVKKENAAELRKQVEESNANKESVRVSKRRRKNVDE